MGLVAVAYGFCEWVLQRSRMVLLQRSIVPKAELIKEAYDSSVRAD